MRPALALSALVAVVLPAAPAAAANRSCGTVNGGFEYGIVANGPSCTKARSIARAWHHGAVDGGKGPGAVQRISGYTCRSRGAGDSEHVRVTCRKGTWWVRFVAGP